MLLNASYLLPIAHSQRWNLDVNAATAVVDYLPGTGQPGNSLSGVGGGILYRARGQPIQIVLDYAYGIDAIRTAGAGPTASAFSSNGTWTSRTARASIRAAQPVARLAMAVRH